jgi:circadian clock protein KaiC
MVPLAKTPTGIEGLDEITDGGLPKGRPTLVAGNAGCGKTLLGMEFLVKGITEYKENAVFVSFEESIDDLIENVASLGYDLKDLIAKKKLRIDQVKVERSEIEETGDYDLEGLFIRLDYAIKSVNAKRVVLDTLESLFAGFTNEALLRAELRRLFQWLKDRGVTAIITGERGDASITRQGLEEYVSDCVILLDHRIENQISTRRMRIVKYRGSTHGTNEYPFLIDEDGISVMPITSIKLNHIVSSRRIQSGIPELDSMLGGGYFEASNVLLSGTAGTGKTNVATYFVNANCVQGKKSLYIAFEESPDQIIRNASSIGLDLQPFVDKGLLKFESTRSTTQGLEMHLARFHKLIRSHKPTVVVVDPITNLVTTGNAAEVRAMLSRMMDMFKSENITAIFTSLSQPGAALEQTEFGVSSFVDTWLLLRDHEVNGERNKLMYVLKSRGTAHSNQVREFVITDNGIKLIDVYAGSEGLLTGSSRIAEEAKTKIHEVELQNRLTTKQKKLQYEQKVTEAQIKSLSAQLKMQEQELRNIHSVEQYRQDTVVSGKAVMRAARGETKLVRNNGKR